MTKAKVLKLLEQTDFPINKGRTNILKKGQTHSKSMVLGNTLRWLLVSAWLKPFIPRTPWGGRLCAPLAATEGQGGLARWSLMIAGAGRPFGGRHGHVGGHLGGFGGGGVPFPIVRRLYGRYLFRSVPARYLRKVPLKKRESFLCIICIEKDTLTFVLKNTTTKILLLKNSYT